MPYMRETCVAGKTIEIRKYYNFHVPPPGEHRGIRKKPTPERIKQANLRKAETDLRRLMNANFTDEDYSITLTYRKGEEPQSIADLRDDAAAFAKKLSRLYKKQGTPFKFIYCMGAGPHRRHIHMLISRFQDMGVVSDAWDKGHANMTKLYSDGNYGDIAAYYIRNAEDTKREEMSQGLKPRRRWNTSHNLIKPDVKKERIPAKDFRKDPKPRKGYQIIKDSIVYGISDLTGMPYLCYTQIKDKDYAGNQLIHSDGSKRKRKRKRTRSIRAGDDAEERSKGTPRL